MLNLAPYPKIAVLLRERKVQLEKADAFCTNIEGEGAHWLALYSQGALLPPPPFDLSGLSPFSRNVLSSLSLIPLGQTRFYHSILGEKRLARAVAMACHHNPFPLFFPCHRVVGLHFVDGYRFGGEIKKRLLDFESSIKIFN